MHQLTIVFMYIVFIYYMCLYLHCIHILHEFVYIYVCQVDTWNDFADEDGNKLNIGELKYETKHGKFFPSFVHHVPARNVKCALALVVHLFLNHSKVTESSIMVEDSAMLLIKETTNAYVFHSNSFGKVNAHFAHFVIDFLSMLLLFDTYTDHNANASHAPWVGRNFSMSEREMIQENQSVLIKFCSKQNEVMAWKFFGTNNKKNPQLGWQVGESDTLWTASVRYVSKFKSGISSLYMDCQDTYKGHKRKETMWIHHFVILLLFHLELLKVESAEFLHDNHSSFVCQFTTNDQQLYKDIFEQSPMYNWLWLGRNGSN
jgi:hypothetical protein